MLRTCRAVSHKAPQMGRTATPLHTGGGEGGAGAENFPQGASTPVWTLRGWTYTL